MPNDMSSLWEKIKRFWGKISGFLGKLFVFLFLGSMILGIILGIGIAVIESSFVQGYIENVRYGTIGYSELPVHRLIFDNRTAFEEGEDLPFTGFAVTYENGVLTKKDTYKDGVRDGLQKTFHDNGQVKEVIYYQKGSPHDAPQSFDEYFVDDEDGVDRKGPLMTLLTELAQMANTGRLIIKSFLTELGLLGNTVGIFITGVPFVVLLLMMKIFSGSVENFEDAGMVLTVGVITGLFGVGLLFFTTRLVKLIWAL